MRSITLETRLLELPVRMALTAAHGIGSSHDGAPIRKLTVVRLQGDGGQAGWGECSALNRIGYSNESAETAFDLLTTDPRLNNNESIAELSEVAPMAMAGLEMAEYDMRLKTAGISLAEFLGIERSHVPAGAAISIGSIDETVAAATEAFEAGFRRVKLKIVPSSRTGLAPAAIIAAVRHAFPDLVVHVDGNGSFDRSTVDEIDAAVEAGATAVEQPFAPAQTHLAAALVKRGATVLADEAATDPETIEQLVEAGACTGVVVKSSRLGGLYPTLELLTWCEENQVPACAGGMQESGLGRTALAVVAGHAACTITGDVGPARRWLAEDPWTDVEMLDGMIAVPSAPGVAAPPDPDVLERFTVRQATRTLSTEQEINE